MKMNCQIIVITTTTTTTTTSYYGEIDPSTGCDIWTPPPAKRLDGQGQKRAPAGPNTMLITDEHIHIIHTRFIFMVSSHVSCYVRREDSMKVVVVQVATDRRMEYLMFLQFVCLSATHPSV